MLRIWSWERDMLGDVLLRDVIWNRDVGWFVKKRVHEVPYQMCCVPQVLHISAKTSSADSTSFPTLPLLLHPTTPHHDQNHA